jgi:hypothetical protein
VVGRAGQRQLLDHAPLGQGEGGWAPAAVARGQRVNAVGVEVVEEVADPVGLVKVTSAILGTGIAWALSSTIWARRQVTTDPVERRRIRSNRWPSSSVISRTRTRSATGPFCHRKASLGHRNTTGRTLPATALDPDQ